MDWNTLIAVVAGGLIAIVPTIINNIYQERKRKEDREEEKEEVRIRTKEKLLGQDIEKCMKLIEDEIISITTIRHYLVYKRYKLKSDEVSILILDAEKSMTIIMSYLFSFDTEIIETQKLLSDFTDLMHSLPTVDEIDKIFADLIESSGKLQEILRDKLISIRDSE